MVIPVYVFIGYKEQCLYYLLNAIIDSQMNAIIDSQIKA